MSQADYRDYTDEKNGKLTITGFSHRDGKNQLWKAVCDCGKKLLITPMQFTMKRSCGCDKTAKETEKKNFNRLKLSIRTLGREEVDLAANRHPNNAALVTFLLNSYKDQIDETKKDIAQEKVMWCDLSDKTNKALSELSEKVGKSKCGLVIEMLELYIHDLTEDDDDVEELEELIDEDIDDDDNDAVVAEDDDDAIQARKVAAGRKEAEIRKKLLEQDKQDYELDDDGYKVPIEDMRDKVMKSIKQKAVDSRHKERGFSDE